MYIQHHLLVFVCMNEFHNCFFLPIARVSCSAARAAYRIPVTRIRSGRDVVIPTGVIPSLAWGKEKLFVIDWLLYYYYSLALRTN